MSMNYNEKKILTAQMTQDGVIEELKRILESHNKTPDSKRTFQGEDAFREWVANLAEVFTDAANDIAYHTKALAEKETKMDELEKITEDEEDA